jgi:hypothetical protein
LCPKPSTAFSVTFLEGSSSVAPSHVVSTAPVGVGPFIGNRTAIVGDNTASTGHDLSASSLFCPKCGGEMKIISFITEASVVRQILEHLNLWEERLTRDPPEWGLTSVDNGAVREPF